jgi:hypothetical protein
MRKTASTIGPVVTVTRPSTRASRKPAAVGGPYTTLLGNPASSTATEWLSELPVPVTTTPWRSSTNQSSRVARYSGQLDRLTTSSASKSSPPGRRAHPSGAARSRPSCSNKPA